MTEAGWTRNKPTVAGWYWWRDDSKSMPHAILVWSTSDNTLQAKGGFWTTSQDVARMDGKWLGPITPDSYQQGRVAGLREAGPILAKVCEWYEGGTLEQILEEFYAQLKLAQQAQGGV